MTPLRVQKNGYCLYLDTQDDHAVREAISIGHIYEPHVTKVILETLISKRVFVDVGKTRMAAVMNGT